MKVAIYVRVSTHYQIDKDSLPLQRNDLINYCKIMLNTNKYEIFEDAGYSGKNTDRPAYKNMISRIKNKEFTHLLVWKIDRISRNLLDFCAMYEGLKKYNCIFVSKNEQFDTSSAMGEAMLKIILVFAELERKLTGERVAATMIDRATKGLWNGAPIPLGYKWSKEIKFPIIDDVEAQTILTIFTMYLSTESTMSVLVYLNEHGIRTKRNGSWTTKTIGDIIRNPFYKGTYRYNYRESARGKIKSEREWILIDDNHPSIVDKDTWNRANALMDRNGLKNTAKFRKNSKTYVFTSLLQCGECSNRISAQASVKRKDGFIPSSYYCIGRYQLKVCSQKTLPEKNIGSFIFSFISNIMKAQKDRKQIDRNTIQDKLLKGDIFQNVLSIKNLDEIALALGEKTPNKYKADFISAKIKKENTSDLEKEKSKYERALERLEDLYLFDDEGMSEKDYILKKNKIKKIIDDINQKNNKSNLNDESNINLTIAVTNFIINDTLLNSKSIDYEDLYKKAGVDAMKDFINAIIEKIIIKDKKIISIKFKNSLTINFLYK